MAEPLTNRERWLQAHEACDGNRDAMWDWLYDRFAATEAECVRLTADNERLQAAELERELGYGAAVDIVERRADERIKALNGELGDALSKQSLMGGLLTDYKAEVARYRTTLEAAKKFAETVLACDSYGCEKGPATCLHADASRSLGRINAALAGGNTP